MIRILVCLLALLLAGPAWAQPDERKLAAATDKMLRFIERETDYSVEGFEVRIQFWPKERINRVFQGARYEGNNFVLGLHMNGLIVLRDDFRLGIDDAMLFHEVVHLVQFHNGMPLDGPLDVCRAEQEAYSLQIQWVKAYSGYRPNALFMAMIENCHMQY